MAPRSKTSRKITAVTRAARTVWNDKCDRILVTTLEQAKREGLVANNGFKTMVWKRVEEALKGTEAQSGGPAKSASACNNRFTAPLKKEYKQVRFFFTGGASGFGWDEETKTVTAPDSVWDDFIKKHPHLEKWRSHSFPLYDELGGLIDGRYATGKNVFHAGADTDSEGEGEGESGERNEAQEVDGQGDDLGTQDMTQQSGVDTSRSPPPAAEPLPSQPSTQVTTLSQASPGVASDTGRKRSATDEEDSASLRVKRPRGHGRGQRANAAGSLEHIAEGLQDIARAFSLDASPLSRTISPSVSADTEPTTHDLDVMTSPSRRRIAIRAVERDGGLSPFDFVKAVKLIQQDVGIADAYLAMQKTANRTEFLASLLYD